MGTRNLAFGIVIGLFIAGSVFYFRTTISEQGPPFIIGLLVSLTLIISLAVIIFLVLEDKVKVSFKGNTTLNNDVDFHKVLRDISPTLNDDQTKIIGDLIKGFLRGRAVYMSLGLIISAFLVLGGLLGSILLFKQNELLGEQTLFLRYQSELIEEQNQKFENQNLLFENQNSMLNEEIALSSVQNKFISEQTDLSRIQIGQIESQNKLFGEQIIQSYTEIQLLRRQDSLFTNQNSLVSFELELLQKQNEYFLAQNELIKVQDSLIGEQLRQDATQNEFDKLAKVSQIHSTQEDIYQNLVLKIEEEERIFPFSRGELKLSEGTISTIIATSYLFSPYKVYEDIEGFYSPQRSALFIYLLGKNYQDEVLEEIFSKANFAHSFLPYLDLSNRRFEKLNLSESYLVNANFGNSSLISSDFKGASLKGANFFGANLSGSIFNDCDLGFVKPLEDSEMLNTYRRDFENGNLVQIGTLREETELRGYNGACFVNLFNKKISIIGANLNGLEISSKSISDFCNGFSEENENYIRSNYTINLDIVGTFRNFEYYRLVKK
ncbi:pentapeptide repeat-containing protein [Lewinella sp. LCG006]|uniref:pentapeptide repeat-containing protein n=1 Tax=Lewinella sp. LCG006 TaxID=3231911 RepID=UPI00345F75B7